MERAGNGSAVVSEGTWVFEVKQAAPLGREVCGGLRSPEAAAVRLPIDGPFRANLGCILGNARLSVRMTVRPELVPFVQKRCGFWARVWKTDCARALARIRV
jgi:hypothetical protein